MKTNENLTPTIEDSRNEVYQFLNSHQGTASRIKRIFDYHYDAIQREISQELSTTSKGDAYQVMDFIVEYLEEVMNWPDVDLTQDGFNRFIANIDQED